MEKIVMWKTADGDVFENEIEAETHEINTHTVRKLESLLCESYRNDAMSIDIAKIIFDRSGAILTILQDQKTQMDDLNREQLTAEETHDMMMETFEEERERG
jgi:hypothetical protein